MHIPPAAIYNPLYHVTCQFIYLFIATPYCTIDRQFIFILHSCSPRTVALKNILKASLFNDTSQGIISNPSYFSTNLPTFSSKLCSLLGVNKTSDKPHSGWRSWFFFSFLLRLFQILLWYNGNILVTFLRRYSFPRSVPWVCLPCTPYIQTVSLACRIFKINSMIKAVSLCSFYASFPILLYYRSMFVHWHNSRKETILTHL